MLEMEEKIFEGNGSNFAKGQGAIFGKKASGKTYFVMNDIIPMLKERGRDYRVIDFIREYQYYNIDNVIEVDYKADGFKDELIKVIKEIDKDTFIIIDCANLLEYQELVKGGFASTGQRDMNWIMDALEDYDCCLVFERVKVIYDNNIASRFTDYLLFEPCLDTRYSEMLKKQFGDKVSTKSNYRR